MKTLKEYGVQFSNYNFASVVYFTLAKTEKEAVRKIKNYEYPHRFVFERILSANEAGQYQNEKIIIKD